MSKVWWFVFVWAVLPVFRVTYNAIHLCKFIKIKFSVGCTVWAWCWLWQHPKYSYRYLLIHYHLQVQATSKKLHKKTDAIFSIYGKNRIIPWHFFWNLSWAFRGRWGRMKIEVKFLRLRPRNFAIILDTFSLHLKMVR